MEKKWLGLLNLLIIWFIVLVRAGECNQFCRRANFKLLEYFVARTVRDVYCLLVQISFEAVACDRVYVIRSKDLFFFGDQFFQSNFTSNFPNIPFEKLFCGVIFLKVQLIGMPSKAKEFHVARCSLLTLGLEDLLVTDIEHGTKNLTTIKLECLQVQAEKLHESNRLQIKT